MIKKLRIKFIIVSMAALAGLLMAIVAGMNIINYSAVVADADNTLTLLSHNRGVFPKPDTVPDSSRPGSDSGIFSSDNGLLKELPRSMSPEAPYESRYFSVLLNKDNEVLQTDTGKIKAVDSKKAIEYAMQVISEGRDTGFADSYRFVRCPEGDRVRVTFLDCGQKLYAFRIFLVGSISMALAGYLIFFFVILFFSGRIVRPVAESYEKQKRFITDAGHEIKTPLTIIRADADVLEMEYEENEWLQDIRKQAERLTALTNDLVTLSRMEETGSSMQMIEFPVSDVVSEAASSFQALAHTQGKEIQCHIQPLLSLTGSEKAIRQLVGILLDNSLKYSPDAGTVSLSLQKQGRTLQLSVANSTCHPLEKRELPLLFERFYRTDPSRSSQTGGHGIGLSVAKAIAEAHNGKIQARTEDGHSLQIIVSLPA